MSVSAVVATPEAVRVGPNAILQTLAAVERLAGPARSAQLLRAAGLPPAGAGADELVAASDVRCLNDCLRRGLGDETALVVLREAGRRTADYLLAHRIPGPAQALLRHLPPMVAGHCLLGAIARNSWTFAGPARVEMVRGARRARLTIDDNPLAFGPCAWHEAVFERLLTALAGPRARACELACCRDGAAACTFELAW